MKCPNCMKHLTLIEIVGLDDETEDTKLIFSCSTSDTSCVMTMIYIHVVNDRAARDVALFHRAQGGEFMETLYDQPLFKK